MAIYLIKINIALIILFGFYKMIYASDTFFSLRRFTLLAIYLIALAIPAFNLSYWLQSNETIVSMADTYSTTILPTVTITPKQEASIDWKTILKGVYFAGLVLLTIRFLWQLATIIRIAIKSPQCEINGIKIRKLSENEGPFSFFNWIFINTDKHSQDELREIILHEQTHCNQYHSLDMVLSELLCIVFWYNPFFWLLKREINLNLEYIVDNHVVGSGHNSTEYQYHLLRLTYKKNVATISNNFNVLPLKKRIKMMNKKRTNGAEKAKYLFLAPLAATLLLMSNIEIVANTMVTKLKQLPIASAIVNNLENKAISIAMPETTNATEIATEITTNTTIEAATEVVETPAIAEDNKPKKVYDTVEQMPAFQGNIMQWLAENIEYPEEAIKNNEKGRVIVKFIIDENGNPINPEIVRGISPSLDAEAIRVVKKMPKWIPGTLKGKPAAVYFTLPIAFAFDDSEASPKQTTELNPIYIVDGKEVSKEYTYSLNPNDIESMKVLKDKSAIEKYGEKAKNGAIEITLKSNK